MELAEEAARAEDPWQGFVSLMEGTCAMLADDRGYSDVYRSRVADTPVVTAAQERLTALKTTVTTRAKRAGVLRTDLVGSDLAVITWGLAGVMDATRDSAPDAWRRQLALILDGLRPAAAHPLPAPMTRPQLMNAAPRKASG